MTKILHTDVFTQRDAYTQGCFYTWMLLHRDAFHKDMLLHRRLHIQMLLRRDAFTRSYLYAQVFLHRDAFTQRNFLHIDTQVLPHTNALHSNAFTQRSFYTHTHTCFYTESLLTQSILYTEKLLHKYAYAEIFLNANTFIQRRFYTQIIHRYLYKEAFCTDTFTQRCFYTALLD